MPESELELLLPYVEQTALKKNEVLLGGGSDCRKLYFPTTALVSCMASTSVGEQTEIFAAGSEDVIGLAVGQNQQWRAKVQIGGSAATFDRGHLFSLLPKMQVFRDLLFDYLGRLTIRIGQRVCCAEFHRAPARICLWLALAAEITHKRDLECTHQAIADAIGVRRATVTVVLDQLQLQRIVECRRGRIALVNAQALESRACECFGLLRVA